MKLWKWLTRPLDAWDIPFIALLLFIIGATIFCSGR